MSIRIIHGDMLAELPKLVAGGERFHACVTDPPYEIGFMGRSWDRTGIAFRPETWRLVFDALLPGAHMLCFGGTRTSHRMTCAIEDAGFEIRDTILWLFGSGFPKSLDVSKAIDKAAGMQGTYGEPKSAAHAGWINRGRIRGDKCHEGWQRPYMQDAEAVERTARQYVGGTEEAREWSGWGTALKPAWENIILAVKPLDIQQEWVTIRSEIFRLWGQLWSMLPANIATEFSALSPVAYGAERFGSALCNAEGADNTPDVSCDRMDTSQFVSATISSLSTVCLWNATLAARCSHESTSIIEMELSTTTDLRILKFSLSKITPRIIIQAHKSGAWSSADACPAAQYLNASVVRWNATRELSALVSAIEQEQHHSQAEGASLSPAFEPIILARKPLSERTVAANVLRYGTGALNINASRVATDGRPKIETKIHGKDVDGKNCFGKGITRGSRAVGETTLGRWPANVIHDGSDEVLAAFPAAPGQQGRLTGNEPTANGFSGAVYGNAKGRIGGYEPRSDSGSAARFFWSSKADAEDRCGSKHPTIKPTDLIRYLVRLITPPNGRVLDPFAGTGTTGLAADQLGFDAVLIEQDAQYVADARCKVTSDAPLFTHVDVE